MQIHKKMEMQTNQYNGGQVFKHMHRPVYRSQVGKLTAQVTRQSNVHAGRILIKSRYYTSHFLVSRQSGK